jgi:hypothetical protein
VEAVRSNDKEVVGDIMLSRVAVLVPDTSDE